MELKAEPEMKTNLHEERVYFWNKMLWQEREHLVEKNLLYVKTTKFIGNI